MTDLSANKKTLSEYISLYIHIPYCIKKCPYCDFNSYAFKENEELKNTEKLYGEAIIAELSHYRERPDWHSRICRSVFFGGGTPSLFSPIFFEHVLRKVQDIFQFSEDLEISLEANPGTIYEPLQTNRLKQLKSLGINRISLGAQSFSDKKLCFLGRIHSSEDTKRALENIKDSGFKNISLDLIFGIARETIDEWQKDLLTALSFSPKHLSTYALTIEKGTPFFKDYEKGIFRRQTDDLQASLFETTQEVLESFGMLQYEISNYAVPGYECIHNISYWDGHDYLGLGAGAHSYLRKIEIYGTKSSRWKNIESPNTYIKKALSSGNCRAQQETLTKEQEQLEFFLLGLRRSVGIKLSNYEKKFNSSLNEEFSKNLSLLADNKLISITDDSICLTKKGFLLADEVINSFSSCL